MEMRNRISLILVVALLLSSLVGLTAVAEGSRSSAAPSYEIAAFNVSVKANVELLFAVPAAGYEINDDGSVDNLQVLVWKEGKANGAYNKDDAVTNGAVLNSKGVLSIGGVYHLVFTYNGLSASEMADTVYVRTLYTAENGMRSYSEIHDYSIAEFANTYLNKDGVKNKPLIEAMIDYGHFVAAYAEKTSYTSTEVKELKKVTVNTVLGSNPVGQQTQLVKGGTEVKLKAPAVAEGFGTAPTWSGSAITNTKTGLINTSADTTVTATYTNKALIKTVNFNQYIKSDGTIEFNVPGTGISSAYSKNGSGLSSKKYYYPTAQGIASLNYVWETYGGFNISNNLYATAAVPHLYSYTKWEVAGQTNVKATDPETGEYLTNSSGHLYYSTSYNQYIRFSHNGAGLLTYDKPFVTASASLGLADSMGFTYSIDLMSGKDGTFPKTTIGFDRYLGTTDGSNTNSPALFTLNEDGSVTLAGKAVEYNGIKTTVIASSISQTKFQKVSVYADIAGGRYYAYLDGRLVAVTDCTSLYNYKSMYEMLDAHTNTRFQLVMRGGYAGSLWTNAIPTELTEGENPIISFEEYTLKAGESASYTTHYVYDETQGCYRAYNSTTDKTAQLYVGTLNDVDALEQYIDENYYFYYDNVGIYYGNTNRAQ